MTTFVIENAEKEIVLALKKHIIPTVSRQATPERRDPVRLPVPVANRDLEAAIDDMIERFPTTLSYLAK